MQTPIAESRVHSYQYFVRMVTRARAREFVKGGGGHTSAAIRPQQEPLVGQCPKPRRFICCC
jgi:hypothetical protein